MSWHLIDQQKENKSCFFFLPLPKREKQGVNNVSISWLTLENRHRSKILRFSSSKERSKFSDRKDKSINNEVAKERGRKQTRRCVQQNKSSANINPSVKTFLLFVQSSDTVWGGETAPPKREWGLVNLAMDRLLSEPWSWELGHGDPMLPPASHQSVERYGVSIFRRLAHWAGGHSKSACGMNE